MVIADDLPTDKPQHEKVYGIKFDEVRTNSFKWLSEQPALVFMPFFSGNTYLNIGYQSILVLPSNACFFAGGLSDLQGFIPKGEIEFPFKPRAAVYLVPPFRHTYYKGKQIVVHNRLDNMHELFSYNLYPGPSAKKGIYGVLINIGEKEGWGTLHAATVSVVTPYELHVTIMHEGASGGGKSEMIEQFHRLPNGKFLLGQNVVTKEQFILDITDPCELHPVTDDMALCHHSMQNKSGKICVADAEDGWFLRVNHVDKYGTDPTLERSTIHPKEPLIFINIDGQPNASALLWEHIQDEPGKSCPNPRVVMPRTFVENYVMGTVEVDVRSFGIRQPICRKERPTYGIAGMFHILPPALAWLWRLVAPRGDSNPSIVDSIGMQSEGVGSYWPFATGRMVDQANLLLHQIQMAPGTKFILIPNQNIGAYHVGFSGQWATREYLSRRGGVHFKPNMLAESRCPLLGYSPESVKLDGFQVPVGFLQTNLQPEVGDDGYDAGAVILSDFFKRELAKFRTKGLSPLGKSIIDACMDDANVRDYLEFIPVM
jgi:hypothetical protein